MPAQRISIFLALSLLACGSGSGAHPDAESSLRGEFQSFTPIVFAETNGTISVTTAPGNIGCSLVQTLEAVAVGAEQIYINTSVSLFSPRTEPIIAGDCELFADTISNDCALYRRWNAMGELEATVFATSGAISSTPSTSGGSAQIDIDLVFPGGKTFTTSFFRSAACIQ